jgi:hypothetical protein
MTPTIIEALDDPGLFAPHFRGGTWRAWRAFLAALFGLQMDDDQIELYRAHTARTAPPVALFIKAALIIGRRGGKSRILALIACYLACFREYSPFLAPGEVATIAIIAANRAQARSIFRFTIGLLRAVPMLAALIEDDTAETITLKNRVVIEIHTASFRVTRGYTFAAVLADETAFWRSDETSANPDVEIFRALRPGLSSLPGAMLLNASSPYRKAGELHSAFARHYGRDDARVLVWKAPTLTMNPSLNPAIVAEAYEDDPEAAAAEFGGEFRSDIADFVSRSIVEACIESAVHERPPRRTAGTHYSAFIDAAGGSGSDSMTCAIAHLEDGIPTLDALRERKPPFSPDDVVLEFAALMGSYGISRAESDKWGGDWVGEAFRKRKITVVPSAKPKADIYRELLPLLNAHRCALLDHQRLISQLVGLERRTARSGHDSIDHAPGSHDDIANAVAGVLLLVGSHRPMQINPAAIEQMRNRWRRHA